MKFDGSINIATGLSVESKIWKNEKLEWSKLVDRLSKPIITSETYKQFITASKDEQGKIKDVGGFVGGFLVGGRRNPDKVLYRQLLTLDLDFAHKDFWDDFTMLFNCAAFLHATHKHSDVNPRYRLLIPLSREVSADEYMAISRRVAGDLNIELFDNTTFETNRLMFWPSVPSDIDYYFKIQDGPWIDADAILDRYSDWRDTSEWPTAQSSTDTITKALKKQEDPTEKKNIIGIFCRTYSIKDAIEKFLSEVYIPTKDDRFTYTKGSTSAGLVIYDEVFAYSHHGTDPAGGRLCNAFDLVRIHKFGHLDKKDTSASTKAMEELIINDVNIKHTIANEKFAEAKFDFVNDDIDEEIDTTWTEELEVNTKGEYVSSAPNLNIILQNDQMLKKVFSFNTFDNKIYVNRSLPWRKIKRPEPLRDVDYSGVRNYIETIYGIVSSSKIDDALALEFERQAFHPIVEYIKALVWDGVERITTLGTDYFGAETNDYTKAAFKKTLVGAVARVFEPGVKFDLVLTLIGPQGCGKSTFVKKMGKRWFSDTFITVQGKEAFEQIQGAWLIEMAELSGLKKAEVESIKHFISKAEDMFRPAYGRVIETYKRQCVFIGTTNNKDFLRDPTGNRRFMPIVMEVEKAKYSIFTDLTEEVVSQLWAEAYQLYLAGEDLYLKDTEEMIAKEEQYKHSEVDERRGIIEEYLNRLLPNDWETYDLYKRRDWLNDPLSEIGTEPRVYACVAEIWCECLNKDKTDMSRYNTREINEILKSLPDWEAISSTKNFPIYGKQKFYARKLD